MEFKLPKTLMDLLASGVWPSDRTSSLAQNLKPLVAVEQIREFAPEEDALYLNSPPFRTIAQEIASASAVVVTEYWNRFGALDQIIPEKSLILGDFGLGSDAPLILNYALDIADPPVWRLRWRPDHRTEWVQGASNFDEFVAVLGLANGPHEDTDCDGESTRDTISQ